MKIVIPGGSGHVGVALRRALGSSHDLVILTRQPAKINSARAVLWDGRTLGAWADEIDGADVVINLAGRSVNCRYTDANLKEMYDSRIESTRIVGEAISKAKHPPSTWLQMSTATIYAHRFDAPNDEHSGIIGGNERDAPAYWAYSIKIATAWERAQRDADTPRTRKVALRSAMVMSVDKGSVFDLLTMMTRLGLGGPIGGGKQYVSWIHEHDFVRAVVWLIEHGDVDGAVNLASPGPLPQRQFQADLRAALGIRVGLPAMKWMMEIGAFVLRTDTELLLKSRRVVPTRLIESGFAFHYPSWPDAVHELVTRRHS